MHLSEAVEYLLGKVFDVCHWNRLLGFFGISELIFETTLAKLHDDVLNQSLFCVKGVKEVNKLDNVGGILEQGHHLVLS